MHWQVLWVDLLTRREFEAGFGSHTPIFSGQTRCVRYYMNFQRGLALFKEVLLEARCPAPPATVHGRIVLTLAVHESASINKTLA